MDIGERIKLRRKKLGLSAEEVAEKLGVSPATIYRYESNDIVNMKIDKLEPIAHVLHTTPAYLMGWDDTEQNKNTDGQSYKNEIPACEVFEQCYGKEAFQAVKLFLQLDTLDKGRVIGSMETLLKDEKYSAKEESLNGKAI